MERTYFEEQSFNEVDYSKNPLDRGDYEYCIFNKCNFSNTDLSSICFTECEFNSCNLSTAKLGKTGFREARFRECKMLGLHFEHCDEFLFSLQLANCTLNHSSFFGRKLVKTVFLHCVLKEVDFSEADLSGAVFDHCDLEKALFENTNLQGADFRTAFHYTFDPEVNKIKKARFSRDGVMGLLGKYGIVIE